MRIDKNLGYLLQILDYGTWRNIYISFLFNMVAIFQIVAYLPFLTTKFRNIKDLTSLKIDNMNFEMNYCWFNQISS